MLCIPLAFTMFDIFAWAVFQSSSLTLNFVPPVQCFGVRNVGPSPFFTCCRSQELRCTVQHSQRTGCLHRRVRADAIPVAHVRGPESLSESAYPYPILHCSGAVLSFVLVHSYESDAFKVYRMRESISRKLAVWRVIGDARVQRVDAAVDCPFKIHIELLHQGVEKALQKGRIFMTPKSEVQDYSTFTYSSFSTCFFYFLLLRLRLGLLLLVSFFCVLCF